MDWLVTKSLGSYIDIVVLHNSHVEVTAPYVFVQVLWCPKELIE